MTTEYLIKEVTPNNFEIWHKVPKKRLTWKGWKRWEEFEHRPFHNWVLFKGKLYNNSFKSMDEAIDFLKAEKAYKNKKLEEKLIVV